MLEDYEERKQYRHVNIDLPETSPALKLSYVSTFKHCIRPQ